MKKFLKTILVSVIVILTTLCFTAPVFAGPTSGFDQYGYN